jgi:hypothetical protein
VRTIPVSLLVLLLLFAAGAAGQQPIQPIFSHALNFQGNVPATSRAERTAAAPETLRVLAAMIAFQEDDDTRTSGNGSFDLTTSAPGVIDPAPRDKQYFENHMLFAKNYFAKASDGALVVVATVLDSVYRLGQPMRRYSPPRSSATNAELGSLVEDAWHAVDSATPGIAFAGYDAFILFHAGVGRDIDLVSIYGYDPTPYDLPSLYLNLQSMRAMFGSSYEGVAVAGGAYHITSTMVLPETENREIATLGGTALLELSINGLLAASIGSHLGLPDLFDTKTGRSGIGRFGLMDGQSIFSWNGVFPPEPSAWERAALGWIQPLTVPAGSSVYELPAVGVPGSPDTVYKALISAKEYFLIENRSRDAFRDGSHVTMVRGGVTTEKTFPRDTTGFNAFNQDSLFGVITDVDEFDWSLPGGVNSKTHELFDGGILIWHIDENVIDANLASATVNADPSHRGVDLEEADGSQDIGQSYGFLSAGSGSEDGTALDFWYRGNAAPLRLQSNLFGPNSNPNSLSNSLANSHITVTDFSARGPRMSARIDVGDGTIRPLPGFPKQLGSAPAATGVLPADLDGDGTAELLVTTAGGTSAGEGDVLDGAILAWRQDGSSYSTSAVLIGASGSSFDQIAATDLTGDGTDEIAFFSHPSASGHTSGTAAVCSAAGGAPSILYSTGVSSTAPLAPYAVTASAGSIVWGGNVNIRMDKATGDFSGVAGDAAAGVSTLGATDVLVTTADTVFVERSGPNDSLLRVSLGVRLVGAPAVGDLNHDGTLEIVVVSADGKVFVLDSSLNVVAPFPLDLKQPVASSPAIADVDGDGYKDIVVVAGREIIALNARGAVLDHFPVTLPTDAPVMSSPVVGDIDGDGAADICIGLMDGLIAAYNAHGERLPGFPLQAGHGMRSAPTLFRTAAGKVGIAAATDDRALYAWEYDAAYAAASMPWPMYLHDPQHSGYEGLNPAIRPISGEFLPASRTYNWPNPVGPEHDFKTHIRYYVGADATVTIKILDTAGDLVTEFPPMASSGGMDHEIVWDVSGVQSGVYFAHVEASGSGSSGASVIKIAVVK